MSAGCSSALHGRGTLGTGTVAAYHTRSADAAPGGGCDHKICGTHHTQTALA